MIFPEVPPEDPPVEESESDDRLVNDTCRCGKPRFIGSTDFYIDHSSGLPRNLCKECTAEEGRRWRRENPEKHKASYRKRNHEHNLKERFGITVEEFNALVALSDGRCGICREPESRDRRLSLDHDHRTGQIRGFLCSRCNLTLGSAHDDERWLQLAMQYLQSSEQLRTSDLNPPVPVILYCPMCMTQHVDVGEFATKRHHTHACQNPDCGLVWRPALVATVGVKFLPGFNNAATEGKEGTSPDVGSPVRRST